MNGKVGDEDDTCDEESGQYDKAASKVQSRKNSSSN